MKTNSTFFRGLILSSSLLTFALTAGSPAHAAEFKKLLTCTTAGDTYTCNFAAIPEINQNNDWDPAGRQGMMCDPTSWTSIFQMLKIEGYTFGGFNYLLNKDPAGYLHVPSELADFLGTNAQTGTPASANDKLNEISADLHGPDGRPLRGQIPDLVDTTGKGQFTGIEIVAHIMAGHPGVLSVSRYKEAHKKEVNGVKEIEYKRESGHAMVVRGFSISKRGFSRGDVNSVTLLMMDPEQIRHRLQILPATEVIQDATASTTDGVMQQSNANVVYDTEAKSTDDSQLIIPVGFRFLK